MQTLSEYFIKTYQILKNGREAYYALCQHNLVSSKWDKIVYYSETYVINKKWNGNNHQFTLHYHINKHCEDNNGIHRLLGFVQYELTNEHTRLVRLIKSIT